MGYSFSQIETYQNCPLAYKFKKIDKISYDDSLPQIVGKLFHEIAAEYFKFCYENKRSSDSEKLNAILMSKRDQCTDEAFDDLVEIVDTFSGVRYLDLSYQTGFEFETEVAFDREWNVVPWKDGNASWRGILDEYHFEDDLLVITDYKTNRAIKPRSSVEKNFQLLTYAYMMHMLYPKVERFVIRLDYVRYGQYRSREIDLSEIETVPERINQFVAKIESDTEFLPRVSSFCDGCSFTAMCSKYQNAMRERNDTPIIGADDALSLAEQLRIIDSRRTQIIKRLKTWIDANEPITVGNELLDYHTSQSFKFDDPALIAKKLLEIGLNQKDIWSAMKISQTDLKKVLKNSNKIEHWEDLLELAKIETSQRFEFKKTKE